MAPSPPFPLPKSHPDRQKLQALTSRYKSFRLDALLLAPSSFGSTHAREAAYPPETWTARLSNPRATTIVIYQDATQPPHSITALTTTTTTTTITTAPSPPPNKDDSQLTNVLTAKWLATLTINGPLDPETRATSLHLDPSLVDFGPTHPTTPHLPVRQYVLNGMFVIPSARGNNLGTRILEYAKDHVAIDAKTHGKERSRARISLIVDYDNVPARKTYEKSGFEIVHRYWFDDYREGREPRTEAAVMVLDLDSHATESTESRA
ncbi:hypothetical protein CORC01_06926 [Colletotrichum orchidophilum]|uniref:N-acetyltransferase domain-containing protein n=1 Tax=Colletotrichum orchidophilum TaxID=1209926 RepID=A0A1G4B8G1_9PEZI|nr:uncharacterized protein CORC01_06926 [Colletotrichum orchidophilum]OHE97721.1 hypothetical protein CORC01_06926 [Colletotrichum orchidophilum]